MLLVKIFGALAALWLLWVAAGTAFQRRFLYPGAYARRALPPDPPPGLTRIWLDHRGGRAEAWHLPPARAEPGTPAPAVIHFHGNGELVDDVLDPVRPFVSELGMHLLLVEYPGFGRSTGVPSMAAVMEVAEGAWRTLADRRDVDAGRIVTVGRSLGGGPAAEVALRRGAAALILQSTFTDVGTMAARHSGLPPFLIRDRWRPLEALRRYEGPALVIHGRKDRIVPFRHAEALAAAREGVRFLPLDCAHNDCPPPGAAWWEAVRDFLTVSGVIPEGEGAGPATGG